MDWNYRPGCRLLRAVRDEAALEVVGGDAHRHAVARDHADPILAHLAVESGQNLVVLAALHLVVATGEDFRHHALQLDQIFLAQSTLLVRRSAAALRLGKTFLL